MTMKPPISPRRTAALALLAWAAALGCTLSSAQAQPAAGSADAAPAAGLSEVAELARINGEALACQDGSAMRRAKALMLSHAPKTARYGQAFDAGTQEAFLAVTRSAAGCGDAPGRAARLEALAPRLQRVLPAQAQTPSGAP